MWRAVGGPLPVSNVLEHGELHIRLQRLGLDAGPVARPDAERRDARRAAGQSQVSGERRNSAAESEPTERSAHQRQQIHRPYRLGHFQLRPHQIAELLDRLLADLPGRQAQPADERRFDQSLWEFGLATWATSKR